ncbi:hypothetical protein QF117_05070 [Vibrio sp. YMD68]|uniref:hypothetical protein n=1 Tax=Vibrio sp. YMD68 TaxID=3042300 RepID=UPI00249AF341|nr:hypothetical protein [Vibrio sp. YMD68]WGV98229.1 hypothetical protein QF117_05070 [Vibrio sp. YMD68]
MTPSNFEQLKTQLHLLTPQQLKSLLSEIQNSLGSNMAKLVTEEELNLISSLFS